METALADAGCNHISRLQDDSASGAAAGNGLKLLIVANPLNRSPFSSLSHITLFRGGQNGARPTSRMAHSTDAHSTPSSRFRTITASNKKCASRNPSSHEIFEPLGYLNRRRARALVCFSTAFDLSARGCLLRYRLEEVTLIICLNGSPWSKVVAACRRMPSMHSQVSISKCSWHWRGVRWRLLRGVFHWKACRQAKW